MSKLSYLMAIFEDEMDKPSDNTQCYWYMNRDYFSFSEDGEKDPDPDYWENGGYSSDRTIGYHEKNGYVIVTLDDGCGGQYQAFFDLDKRVDPQDF